MKYLIVLIAILSLSCTTLKKEKAQPKKVLKLMTFNILGGRNTDGKRDLKRVADVINKFKPDFVSLQEVDVKTNRIRKVDIPKELAKLTGMHAAFGEAMPYDGGSYGEAVLSKYPITKSVNHKLPAEKGAEPRAALEVQANVPGIGKVVFIGTHFDHLRYDKNRMMQVKKVMELFKNSKGHHFLTGDLNARPDSKAMKELYKLYADTWSGKGNGFTIPVTNKRARIDYILVHKNDAKNWKVTKSLTADQLTDDKKWQDLLKVASDHLAVYVELEKVK